MSLFGPLGRAAPITGKALPVQGRASGYVCTGSSSEYYHRVTTNDAMKSWPWQGYRIRKIDGYFAIYGPRLTIP